MLKAILVEDEANATEALIQLLQIYHPDINLCACCSSLTAAISEIKKHRPDLIFLDVQLGKENGFDLFKHFPEPDFKVIFTTAHQKYAVDAFRFAALDYLLKPVNSSLLSEALNKATRAIGYEKITLNLESLLHNIHGTPKSDKKIILKTAESIHLVSLSDIMYCEADGGYTNFHFADKSRIMVSSTMGDYEELFRDYSFCRIHQSFLLNLACFKRYEKTDGGMAILKDGTRLPVATRKKEYLLQCLAQL